MPARVQIDETHRSLIAFLRSTFTNAFVEIARVSVVASYEVCRA
jgi:hypothetical protein